MKNFSIDDLPPNVLMVMTIIDEGRLVGSKTYQLCIDTINKYPEYFPWEHKYNSIPKEVHESFLLEAFPKSIDNNFKPNDSKTGLFKQIKNIGITYNPLETKRDFVDLLNNLMSDTIKNKKRKIESDKRLKKIWNKHYGKYQLEFRSYFI